ncbi:MAG: cobyrinate a,c-diamide synthase [Rhodospirillales bacterium]|nr:cobyrinate a,c-diamide synthase [Rhodospirillales bacterium]
MAHIFISAAHKSSGKTTIAIGLARAFARRGIAVQPFKKGPDYIDPLWLGAAAGRPCHNLDFFTMGQGEIENLFARRMAGTGLGLIEGNKGLYDGLDLDGANSNAALAKRLAAPVVLVIDARGMTRGIAPLLLGYRAFDADVRIGGVILNQIGGARHEAKLRAIIAHYTEIPVLGAVQRDPALEIVERHLGLMPSNEWTATESTIETIADAVARQVDLDRVLALAASAPAPRAFDDAPRSPLSRGGRASGTDPVMSPSDVRVGIARDSAFGFYYPGDLEALEAAGAELVFFDSLRARNLPNLDGLFIGGGFPETHMAGLEANASLRADIRAALACGLPAYAECGGMMYLCRNLAWKGDARRMVGAIAADVAMHARPQGRGYVRLRETGAGPWPMREGRAEIPAHEFHHGALENLPAAPVFAYEVVRGHGIDGRHDGLVQGNLLASFSHLRDTDANHWAGRFVAFVRRCKHQGVAQVHAAAPAPEAPIRREVRANVAPARVHLVGAGPGDPGLLTVRAKELLGLADIVVYDRLVSPEVLALARPGANRIFAGKAARSHFIEQGEINRLLVRLARGGKRVVRLKGGDPFVFGRGSEEALELARNRIAFEVVPGVSAATGCAARAGIPLTHRGLARAVTFVTGHAQEGHEVDLNWKALADAKTTLVIYMGLTNAALISHELIKAGLAPTTPVAAIEKGTTPEQKTVLTTLADLAECVVREQLQPPTLFVVGEVVELAKELNWASAILECGQTAHG